MAKMSPMTGGRIPRTPPRMKCPFSECMGCVHSQCPQLAYIAPHDEFMQPLHVPQVKHMLEPDIACCHGWKSAICRVQRWHDDLRLQCKVPITCAIGSFKVTIRCFSALLLHSTCSNAMPLQLQAFHGV